MGFHASIDFDLEFTSEQAREECKAAMIESREFDIVTEETPLDELASTIIEDSSEFSEPEPMGLAISGGGGGSCYFDARKAKVLAPFVTGTVTLDGDDGHVRYRFRDGKVATHSGEVTFPTDEKRTVWSLTVIGPTFPGPTISLHNSEADAVESLEERYGDEVERESDIVSDLENWGYRINVDSHEI